MRESVRYGIITPARDEERHIEATLDAVLAQTVHPVRWIIVDDGSSDSTGAILDRYARRYSWISVVHRSDRGSRSNGAGVVDTFYVGYKQLESIPWDFIVKLDADLTFPADYFQRCLAEFTTDQSLGIGGGALYNVTATGAQFEAHPWFHVRGATKIYRRLCWEQIGGIWHGPGWDTIDEVKANMLHWKTRTFPDIHLFHHRMTGAAEGGWRDNVKNGRGNYAANYHPLYVAARCIHRLRRKPYIIGSIGMFYGYLAAHWQRIPRMQDRGFSEYIRQQQMNRLVGRPTIWQ